MRQTLRPYQVDAKQAVRDRFSEGRRRVCLVLPTGAGKTTIAASIIEDAVNLAPKKNAVLFIAHRTELIGQCSARLDQFGLLAHGVIMSSHPRYRPHAPIQVASIQTLGRRSTVLDPAPRLIIYDECHRSLGATGQKVVKMYPTARAIGLTATPWRLDKRGLGRLYDDMVVGTTYAELIASGFLVEPRVMCPWTPELGTITLTRAGEYDADEVADLVDRPQRVDDIVNRWLEEADWQRTVCFASSVAHSMHIVRRMREYDIRAGHLDGEQVWLPDDDEPKPAGADSGVVGPDGHRLDNRGLILWMLERGDLHVLSNYGVLTEGWDCPACAVCILARPTASLALYMQMVGRVLRPAVGKAGALVLDFAGCAYRHGWPTATQDWTLADRPRSKRKAGERIPGVKVCENCLVAMPAAVSGPCPVCGHVNATARKKILDGESGVPMVEIEAEQAAEVRGSSRFSPRAFNRSPGRGGSGWRRSTFSRGKR